jgi:hypothetical protein
MKRGLTRDKRFAICHRTARWTAAIERLVALAKIEEGQRSSIVVRASRTVYINIR